MNLCDSLTGCDYSSPKAKASFDQDVLAPSFVSIRMRTGLFQILLAGMMFAKREKNAHARCSAEDRGGRTGGGSPQIDLEVARLGPLTRTGPTGRQTPGRAAAKWPPPRVRPGVPMHARPRLPFPDISSSRRRRARSRVTCRSSRSSPWLLSPLLLLAPRWRWVASTPCSFRLFLRRRVGASERRCGIVTR